MNNEMVETVLHELLNEQKEISKTQKQLISKIEYLSEKIENIKTEMQKHCITSVSPDIKAQPKNVIHQRQIMIFPEFKSQECYRLLFNCIIYLTIATYSFVIIKAIVDYWCK